MKKILLLLVLLTSVSFSAGSREGDSLALVAIYNANPGNSLNWDFSNNLDSDAWEGSGMYFRNGRVELLTLTSKNITTIPAEIGSLTSLRSLYASYNSLTTLPAEIGSLTSLNSLHVDNNSITTLPAEITAVIPGTWLNVAYNGLKDVNLTTEVIAWLDLYGNDISGNSWRLTQRDIVTAINIPKQTIFKQLSVALANSKLNFSTPVTVGTNLSIFSINGKEIIKTAVQGSSIKIPTLSKGLYLIKIGNEKLNKIFKISVQ